MMIVNVAVSKGGSGSITVPSSAWAGTGSAIFNVFNNDSSSSISILPGAGITLMKILGRPSTASGARTVGPLGMATVFLMNNGTEVYVTGMGVS
jgi:hypothetical protein